MSCLFQLSSSSKTPLPFVSVTHPHSYPDPHSHFLLHPNSRFDSPIITLQVGPTRRIYHAHASVLVQSPVLASKLGSDAGGALGLARSPDGVAPYPPLALSTTDAHLFGRVLEYLYGGEFAPTLGAFVTETAAVEHSARAPRLQQKGFEQTAADLAGLHVLAGRLGLPALRRRARAKLAELARAGVLSVGGLVEVARTVYAAAGRGAAEGDDKESTGGHDVEGDAGRSDGASQPPDDEFRAFVTEAFRPKLGGALKDDEMKELVGVLAEGGWLARDVFHAQRAAQGAKL